LFQIAGEFAVKRLAGVLLQRAFRIEGVQVARGAAHEQRDDGFSARFKVRLLGGVRIVSNGGGCAAGGAGAGGGAEQSVLIEQIRQPQSADAAAGSKKKIASV